MAGADSYRRGSDRVVRPAAPFDLASAVREHDSHACVPVPGIATDTGRRDRRVLRRKPWLGDRAQYSADAQTFFRCHDVAHVLFGCSVDLDDEAVVKISSIFGTSAGFRVLEGYRLHESVEIYKQLPLQAILVSIAHSIVIVPRTIFRCLRQRSRWPWTEFERFLEIPLREIREQFGIQVAHRASSR